MKKLLAFLLLFLGCAAGFAFAVQASFPPTIRVGLTREFANRESINIPTLRIQAGYEENGVFVADRTLESATGFVARVNTNGQVVLQANGQAVFTFTRPCAEPQIRAADGGLTRLGSSTGPTYRGVIALRATTGRITAINVVCPEEYLLSVVPAEMPPSWHPEALKAQTVAARSYLYARSMQGPHAQLGYNVCDTTCCQAYRGTGSEQESTTAAVQATRGVMAYFAGEVITAFYFSSSGGATINSENVWVETIPYLRGVNEIDEFNPIQWTRTFTWNELTNLLQAANVNIGAATGIEISEIAASGIVQELTIVGTTSQFRLRGDRIRTFFNAAPGGTLQSRNFYILEAMPQLPDVWIHDGRQLMSGPLSSFQGLDANGNPVALRMAHVFDGTTTRRIESAPQTVTGGPGITLSGSGWGHGVGMSQHGAEGMARLGYTYQEILMHYYTGVEVR